MVEGRVLLGPIDAVKGSADLVEELEAAVSRGREMGRKVKQELPLAAMFHIVVY